MLVLLALLRPKAVGGGQSNGNLTIDGDLTVLGGGDSEIVGDLTVTQDLFVRGGNAKMFRIDSGTENLTTCVLTSNKMMQMQQTTM